MLENNDAISIQPLTLKLSEYDYNQGKVTISDIGRIGVADRINHTFPFPKTGLGRCGYNNERGRLKNHFNEKKEKKRKE